MNKSLLTANVPICLWTGFKTLFLLPWVSNIINIYSSVPDVSVLCELWAGFSRTWAGFSRKKWAEFSNGPGSPGPGSPAGRVHLIPTWQPFNLSHCIEMHNTHLLGRAGQLSQAYFTHLAPILTPRNLPPTVNKQWPPLRESRMSRHTRFNTSRKTATVAMYGIFLGTNAVDRSLRPLVRIRFCISIVSKISKS